MYSDCKNTLTNRNAFSNKTPYRFFKKGGKKNCNKGKVLLLLADQPPVTTLRIVSLSELMAPSRGTAVPPFNTSTVS